MFALIITSKQIQRDSVIYNSHIFRVLDHLMLIQLLLKIFKDIQRDFLHNVEGPNVRVTKRFLADFPEEPDPEPGSPGCQQHQEGK